MLNASGLAKSHGPRVLFENVSLQLSAGRRIALVGGNGVGKTTLIQILVGLQEADRGEVHRPRDLRIGYLAQDLDAPADHTVLDEAMAGTGHVELARQVHQLAERLATSSGAEHDQILVAYGEAQNHFEQVGGYALESTAQRVLAGLGFVDSDMNRPIQEMSGGWRMRAALARLLVAEPDLLVLDEPTNHLDVDSIAWLETHLTTWPGALLFVSHDRDFIDTVANRVIELAARSAQEYVGGFSEFVIAREENLARLEAAAERQDRQIRQTEQFIERFRYKATKARQVQSRVKALDKIERIAIPGRDELVARFRFPEPQRSARVIAELENITAGYDDHVILQDVNLVIERGRKVALIGPNGAGKSTLVKTLVGQLSPLGGTATLGNKVDVATFSQHQTEVLDLSRSVVEEFSAHVGDRLGKNLRNMLGGFGFGGDAAERKVAELSGGEQTRLALGITMALPVNLLVLDEPTNHLDLVSCDMLEDALRAYPGTVLLITHDRYLIREVADALIEVRHGTARWHEGVDEKILNGTHAGAASLGSSSPIRASTKPRPDNQNPSRKDLRRDSAEARKEYQQATKELRKHLASTEKKWEKAEANLAQLQAELADPKIYENSDALQDLLARHATAKDKAADLINEWEQATLNLEKAESEFG